MSGGAGEEGEAGEEGGARAGEDAPRGASAAAASGPSGGGAAPRAPEASGARRSYTADMVALFRAEDAKRAPDRRVVDDRLAEPLLRAVRSPLLRGAGIVLAEGLRRGPLPLRAMVLVRHRRMDDFALAAIAGSRARADRARPVRQVVLLGAGLDARAYRLPARLAATGAPDDLRFFEVDHPAFSAVKARAVAEVVGPAPHARFVAVDLAREPLGPALEAAGYDRAAPAVFVWEGVTYYLSREGCEGTVRALVDLAAPGSSLIADVWWSKGALGRSRLRVAQAAMRLTGEPFRFAFAGDRPSPAEWLAGLGLTATFVEPIGDAARALGVRIPLPSLGPDLALAGGALGGREGS